MEYIKVETIDISRNRVSIHFEVSEGLKQYFQPERTYFVQYDRDIVHIPESILLIPFVGTIIQVAWLTDAKLEVPRLDKTFVESLERLRAAYRVMYPDCELEGSICVDEIEKNQPRNKRKAAQVFSGGMDAVTTYLRHQSENPVLLTEYGFFDFQKIINWDFSKDKKSYKNFSSDIKAIKEFSKEYDCESSFIYSNYGTFLYASKLDKVYAAKMRDGFWHGLQHAMAILGAAAPIAFDEGAGNLYIASSFTIGNTNPCASDPTTDNEFRFGTTQAVHDGYEMGDLDKARYLVERQKEIGKPLPLRVCSWNDHNCCACEKCVRRMLELSAEGADPRTFGFEYQKSVFQTTKDFLYKEIQFFIPKQIKKWQMITQRMVENQEHVFDKEVVEYLDSYDFEKEKKAGLYRYYFLNFFSILKRKIGEFIHRMTKRTVY